MIPNKFPLYDSSRKTLPYKKEPPYLSLEASLHRALFWHFGGVAIGGYYDPFGMARGSGPIVCQKNKEDFWKEIVKNVISTASIVAVVPFDSEGIWWELQHIKMTNQFHKTTFIMVPNYTGNNKIMTDALDDYGHMPDRWYIVKDKLRILGIQLPDYDETGAFLFINSSDSSVMEMLSFESLWNGSLLSKLLELSEPSPSSQRTKRVYRVMSRD